MPIPGSLPIMAVAYGAFTTHTEPCPLYLVKFQLNSCVFWGVKDLNIPMHACALVMSVYMGTPSYVAPLFDIRNV